ncbi:MAG TPA: glycosyltransferase family 4 protein [Nitrospirota bacterium]|nr:glycosyltransferase family 4 protein [Nitrospirota bacterium]HUL00069.1 glycosyltransferase family 4 protein [Nitrospirota bacterium]
MRIAHIIIKGVEVSGGIEKYALELGSRLVNRGHEVDVYAIRRYKPLYSDYKGVRIIPLPSLKGRIFEKLSATFVASLDQLIRKSDIVHYHAFGQSILSFIPKLRGKPILLQGHGIEWMRSRWGAGGRLFFRLTEGPSLKIADRVTVVSKVQKEYFKKKYNVDTVYIPPGIDEPVRRKPNLIRALGLEGNDYVLFASRLVREKGAHYLIEAFSRLETDKKLVIVGDVRNEDSYKAELKKLAKQKPDKIIFTGYVSREMLQEFYSNAYLFVLPSELEGLSAGLLEAMSYGNACLVSDIEENREGLGTDGFYFRNRDVDDMTSVLKTLLASEETLKDMREKALSKIMTAHSWDTVTDQIERLYGEIVEDVR